MSNVHDFEEVFGVAFGDVVQGTGLNVHLSQLNPKAKGRAMKIAVSHKPWGERPMMQSHFALDSVGFQNAWGMLGGISKYWPTHWWWRNKVWRFAKEHKMAVFAWPSFFKLKRNGLPQAPGFYPGDTFYATFTMENGEGVCLECTLPAGYTGEPVAGFGQRNTDDELMYYCRY